MQQDKKGIAEPTSKRNQIGKKTKLEFSELANVCNGNKKIRSSVLTLRDIHYTGLD